MHFHMLKTESGMIVRGGRNGMGCLSRAAKIAWDVLSGVTKTTWDVLSRVANRCWMFCPWCQKMVWDVLYWDVLSYILLHFINVYTACKGKKDIQTKEHNSF